MRHIELFLGFVGGAFRCRWIYLGDNLLDLFGDGACGDEHLSRLGGGEQTDYLFLHKRKELVFH